MWVLRSLKEKDTYYSLMPGHTYKVGRVNVDIVVRDDISVSRVHAQFKVRSDKSIKTYESEVVFEDLGSTYGSYVGESAIASSQTQDPESGQPSQKDKLDKGQQIAVQPGTRIRFGLLSTIFKLEWKRMVVSSSTLKDEEKENIKKWLSKIGIGNHVLLNEWTPDVTHLVMNQVTLTIKVANAFAKVIPIVTSSFFKDLLTCQNTKQQLPDHNKYVPPWFEKSISADGLILTTLKERRKVFHGKLFAFGTKSQLSKFEHCITNGGGKAIVFGSPDSSYKDPKLFENTNNLLVQKDASFVTTPSNRAQVKLFAEAESILSQKGLKIIPMSAIGLAILHCSTSVHCNPDKQALSDNKDLSSKLNQSKVQQSTIIPETQQLTSSSPKMESTHNLTKSCIPETLPSANARPENNSESMFKEPFLKSKGSRTSKKPSPVITSTPADSLSSIATFSWSDGTLESQDEEADNFWEMATPQKRKADLQDVPAPKRAKDETVGGEHTRVSSSSSIKEPSTNSLVGDKQSEPTNISNNVNEGNKRPTKDISLLKESDKSDSFDMDLNSTEETEILEANLSERKRRHPADKNKENKESDDSSCSKIQRASESIRRDSKQICQALPQLISKEKSFTNKDEFGFIGKSLEIKTETNDSADGLQDVVSNDESKTYWQVRTVSLVVESSFGQLQISNLRRSHSTSLNVSETSVKKFRKQPVVGRSSNLVSCIFIENNEVVNEDFMPNEVSQAPTRALDAWVIRDEELIEDERTRDEVWSFAIAQEKKQPRKRH